MPAARHPSRGRHAAPRDLADPADATHAQPHRHGRETGADVPGGRIAAAATPAPIPTEGAAPEPVTSSPATPDTTAPEQTAADPTAAPVRARGRRAAAPSDASPDLARAGAPSGRRAAAPGGRRAAASSSATRGSHRADGRPSVRTPSRGVPVATLASADAPLNRADRRRRRAPRRSATRVAQGAVAVGLALGVGGFALTPTAAQRAAAGAEGAATTEEDAAAVEATPRLSSDVVQERQAAVVLASSTVQQADTVKADAVASAVPAEAVTPLSTAVAELDTLIAATQSEQPAITALEGERAAAPVLSGEVLASAVELAGSDALADAAAADGATSTSDEAAAEPAAEPTEEAGGTDAAADAEGDDLTGTAADVAATPEDPAAARLTAAVDRVATLTAELQVVTQQTQEAAAAAAAAAEAARKEAQRTSLDSYSNGQIPASALADLAFAPGQQLRADAAESLEQLNVAFTAAFGTNLVITDSYRSYGQQVACRAQKGSLCATPGTSNHGNGTAIDLGGNAYSFGTDQHDWMLAHAEEYGWTLPDWARATGSKPEPWHWEYVG
jgi:LAS superfamily LD-carboxypeptidase LdcB